MTAHDVPGRGGSIPSEEITRAARQTMLGWGDAPVVVLPAPSRAAAATLPREEILAFDIDRGGALPRRIVHAVIFLALGLVMSLVMSAEHYDAMMTAVLPGAPWGRIATGIVAIVLLIVVVCVDSLTVVTWEMYAIAAALSLVVHTLTGESVADIVLVTGVLGAGAYAARRSRIASRTRWRLLSKIIDDHALVEAEVLRHGWRPGSGSRSVPTLRLVLESPQLPGQQWQVQFMPAPHQIDAAPGTGDRVMLFICPADPEVAVVRLVLPA